MKISLGPNLFYWDEEKTKEFYAKIAETDVDIVYLGETVCSKRRALDLDGWMEIGKSLQDAGKEVVLSTLSLLEAESELKSLRRICQNENFMVEANDMSAINLLSGKADFATGPTVNIYNNRTLQVLIDEGLKRWVLPVELSAEALQEMMQEIPDGIETEVFAFGRMPLAIAARCYTARAYNLPKDDCQYRCLDHADGMIMKTKEAESFLCVNGVQTLSAQHNNLLTEVPKMQEIGVDVVRISPQSIGTVDIINSFVAVRAGEDSSNFTDKLARSIPEGSCNGYWFGESGISMAEV